MNTENTSKGEYVVSESSLRLKMAGFLFILFAVFLSIHWQPFGFTSSLDESWNAALNRAFAEEIQFGKDFVYTYGPYGFLLAPRSFPETFNDILVGRVFVGLLMGIGLWTLVVFCWKTNPWSTLFLVPFLFFFPNSGMPLDSFFVTLLTLPLLLYFYVNRGKISPILLLLLIGSALIGLVKHPYLVLGVSFVLLITVDEVLQQRRIPVMWIVYVGSVMGFWLLAAQSLENFFPFLKYGYQIVKGYSATMGTPGPLIEILSYILSIGFFFALMCIATLKRRNTFEFLPIIGLALVFFVTFKTAFVRHDAHAFASATTPIPIACLFCALLWPSVSQLSFGFKKFKPKVPIFLIAWILLFINASLIFHNYANHSYARYFLNSLYHLSTTGRMAVGFLSGQTDVQKIYDESVEKIRKANPLPKISGRTDLYPNETAVIFAYDLPYKPRPVFQSFAAYTGKLAELNAAHLRDADAPENILFDVWAIDQRLPSSDDGLSWPELLTRYYISDMTGKFLVLKRRAIPLNYSLAPLMEQSAKIGEWIELPDSWKSTAIWMQLEVRPTIIGKLSTTLLKLPPLFMEIELADGKFETYRVLADVANSGQLLSPLVKDSFDFFFLAAQRGKNLLHNSEVKRIRLVTKSWATLAYPQSYSITLSRLEFPRQDFSLTPGLSDYLAFAPVMSGQVLNGEVGIVKNIIGSRIRPVLLAHADTRIVMPLPEGVQNLYIGIGILDGAWEGAKAKSMSADGVEFRVLAILHDGREEVLFARWLDPHSNANDRGEKKEEIDLGGITAEKIVLETLSGPQGDPSWDWSYWSEFRFEFQEE